MNVHTFKDATTDRRSALANELADDDDDDEDDLVTERSRRRADSIEGEEESSNTKFNDMGEVIEPFNLKDEREGGGFDENMNYVFQKEKGEVDAWLADMDEAQMERGIGEAAKAQKLKQDKSSAEEQLESERQVVSTSALKLELCSLLGKGENAWQAMRRLAGGSTAGRKRSAPCPGTGSSSRSADTLLIHRLTEVADLLLGRGETSIYEATREGVLLSEVVWEYRGKDGALHGPFSTAQIIGWRAQGFFTGEGAVFMRRRGDDSEDDSGGNEESKGGEKRQRSDAMEAARDRASKRSRVEGGSADLLNDLEDSDEEEEAPIPAVMEQDKKEVRGVDVYAEWQSSDDIEWGLVADTDLQEEADMM